MFNSLALLWTKNIANMKNVKREREAEKKKEAKNRFFFLLIDKWDIQLYWNLLIYYFIKKGDKMIKKKKKRKNMLFDHLIFIIDLEIKKNLFIILTLLTEKQIK